MNLVSIRIHYINCNEKALIKIIRERFDLKTNTTDFEVTVT